MTTQLRLSTAVTAAALLPFLACKGITTDDKHRTRLRTVDSSAEQTMPHQAHRVLGLLSWFLGSGQKDPYDWSKEPVPATKEQSKADDPSWYYTDMDNEDHDCDWIGKFPSRRCRLKSKDGVMASDSCSRSCSVFYMHPNNELFDPTGGAAISTDDDGLSATEEKVEILEGCQDDEAWIFFSRKGTRHSCNWVGEHPLARCHLAGTNGKKAEDSCLVSCGGCLDEDEADGGLTKVEVEEEEAKGCRDDPDWVLKITNARIAAIVQDDLKCDWIAKRPIRRCAPRFQDSSGIKAADACQVSCGVCMDDTDNDDGISEESIEKEELKGCLDDTDWVFMSYKGRPLKCKWIAERPRMRCRLKNRDGVAAADMCQASCGDCLDPTIAMDAKASNVTVEEAEDDDGLNEIEMKVEEEEGCVDDSNWILTVKGEKKDCDWVAEHPLPRCRQHDDYNVEASEACQVACGACLEDPIGALDGLAKNQIALEKAEGCTDDDSWVMFSNETRFENQEHKCDWIAEFPKVRCDGFQDANGVKAMDACQVSCGACLSFDDDDGISELQEDEEEMEGCVNSPDWVFTSENQKPFKCDWVQEHPATRCKIQGDDDTLASEVCLVACGCPEDTEE